MRNLLKSLLLLSFILTIYFIFYLSVNTVTVINNNGQRISLKVLVADEESERIQGLSNTPNLAQNTGMLFVHDQPNTSAYWMKDMNYPIDIIFMDENYNVLDIKPAQEPCRNDTVCGLIFPPVEYTYVLEVPSMWSENNNVGVGSRVITNWFTFVPLYK